MKKLFAVVMVLIVALNIVFLMPEKAPETKEDKKECLLMQRPKINLTEMNPGILPNLLKS